MPKSPKLYGVWYVSCGEVRYYAGAYEDGSSKPYTPNKWDAKRLTEKQAHSMFRKLRRNGPHTAWGFGRID